MTSRYTNLQFASSATNSPQPRTMPARLTDGIISVKEYGAVGDGIHDDHDAIQAAIENGARNGCGIIFFPPGTYYVGSSLILPEIANTSHRYFCLLGCGADVASGKGSTIKAAMGSYILYSHHGSTGAVSIEGLGFINLGTVAPINSEPKNSPDLGYLVTGTSAGSNGTVRLTASAMDFSYQYSMIFYDNDSVDVYGVGGTSEANGTWTISSPNYSLIPWTPITQSSSSAGGSGGTNVRINYFGATGIKVGDSIIISGMNNWSHGISSTANSAGKIRLNFTTSGDSANYHAGDSVSVGGVLNADNLTSNEANGNQTVLSTGSGFIVLDATFANIGHGGSITSLVVNETNGTHTVTAVSLTGVWNTGWFEINVAWLRQGAGGSTRGKWVDLRGTTFSHAWTSGGEWHYNGFAGGCIYMAAGIAQDIRRCSFQVDKGICIYLQCINGYVGNCYFKGGFSISDVHAISATSSGTGGAIRLACDPTGLAIGNRVFVYGVSPEANEANYDYYTIIAVGAGYVEINGTFSAIGTGGYVTLLGSVGFFNGGSLEGCTFENLSVGLMSGFNGPGVLNANNIIFRNCGYCMSIGTIFLPWWDSNIWQVQVAGNWTSTNCILRTIIMENFAVGGLSRGAVGANTLDGLKISSDGSMGVPKYGVGGAGGRGDAHRNISISGTYSGAALDNHNCFGALFDGVDASNSGPGVVYTPPWQGVNTIRNVIGFDPSTPYASLPTGGDIAPYKYQLVTCSDSASAPFESGVSTVGRAILTGGFTNRIQARWSGTQWIIVG